MYEFAAKYEFGRRFDFSILFRPSMASVNVPTEMSTSSPTEMSTSLEIQTNTNTSNQPYDLGVRAHILLNSNFNNSASAFVDKFSNLTVTVSPALGIGDWLTNACNTFGSPINGFVTLIVAISGVFGGWLLKRHT
jgi:hypothetical protein